MYTRIKQPGFVNVAVVLVVGSCHEKHTMSIPSVYDNAKFTCSQLWAPVGSKGTGRFGPANPDSMLTAIQMDAC